MSSSQLPHSRNGNLPDSVLGYGVLGLLGQGAGSAIYVANDPHTGQIYSVKHVIVRKEKDRRFIDQLETEYEVGRRVNHIGLRRSHHLKFERTLLRQVTSAALAMEFFDGVPLDRHVVANVHDTVDCFLQTARALHALHYAGYVHCDLKPINILLDAEERVKVIDLGQACPIGTKKPRIQGTPDYIAPEQVRCEPVSVRTDVYNLGATLYWLLTGQNAPTLYTLAKGPNSFLLDGSIPPPSDLCNDVPASLSGLVMECLRTNVSKRPTDMVEIIRRLESIQSSLPKPAAAPVAKAGTPAAGNLVPPQTGESADILWNSWGSV